MPSVDVAVQIVIRRPRAEVAAYAADPDHVPDWYVNIQSVEWQTPRPVAVGTRVAFVAQFLGRRLAYTYDVAELVPGERLVMRTCEGPFPMETSYAWEPLDCGCTRMTLRNRGQPTGFAWFLTPLLGWMIRRATTQDLARLKVLLESRQA